MNPEKTYLVSDLASELGVPRTTVNDWLRIYGDYLESDVRGKRRVYPERTLAILKEIKAMREQDRTQGMIEEFLADRYGIRPEPVVPEDEPASAAPGPEKGPEPAAPAAEALMRPDPELRNLFQRMLEQENERRDAVRRTVRSMFASAVAILLLTALFGLGIAYHFHTKLAERLAELRKTQEAARNAEDEHAKKLAALTVSLDRAQQDYRRECDKLKAALAEQKREADRALAELKKSEEGRRAAEIAELRRTFAAGQTALLLEWESAGLSQQQAEEKKSEAGNAPAGALRGQNEEKQPGSPADAPEKPAADAGKAPAQEGGKSL